MCAVSTRRPVAHNVLGEISVSRPVPARLATLLSSRPSLHRLARCAGARYGWLLGQDELHGIADLAMMRAWRLYQPHRHCGFRSYAKPWVLGAVRRRGRGERKHRALHHRIAHRINSSPPRQESLYLARKLLCSLSANHARVLIARTIDGASLASVARMSGMHRSWGSRCYGRAMVEARVALEVKVKDSRNRRR